MHVGTYTCMLTHRVVRCDASVDEVEGTGLAVLVRGLELVAWKVGRRRRRADAHVREQSVLQRRALGLQIGAADRKELSMLAHGVRRQPFACDDVQMNHS